MPDVNIEGVQEHFDAIKSALDAVHADLTEANLNELHDKLGDGWEFLKSELGIQDASRDGGHKPPRDP